MIAVGKAALMFFSERYGGRPFVNCGPAAFAAVAAWMGYGLDAAFPIQLRTATGVSLYSDGTNDGSKGGHPRGLSFGALKLGIEKLLPNAPVIFGSISMTDMLLKLPREGHRNRNHALFMVGVPNTDKLPVAFQRLVGQSYDAGHYMAVVGVRYVNEFGSPTPPAVKIFDPMGRTTKPAKAPDTWLPYSGEWIAVSDLEPALQRAKDGNIKVFYGLKNTAA